MIRIKGWWVEVVLAAVFVLVTLAVARGWTHGLDEAVAGFAADHQVLILEWISIGLNKLGQGGVLLIVSGGLSLLLLWRTRNWKFALPWALAFFFTYVSIGPVKIWSMRTSPNYKGPNAVEFFNEVARAEPNGYVLGYPSGHVVNSIVWWGVIVLLASRLWPAIPRRLTRITPPVIVTLTTIYLGHHWLTDNVAAIALGLLIDRLIHRVDWDRVWAP